MKSLKELQIEVKDTIAKMENISKEISELCNSKENTHKISIQHIISAGKRNPIQGHNLLHVDENAKKQYIVMLISVINLAIKNTENSWNLVSRIYCGSECKTDFDELMAGALKIDEKTLELYCENMRYNDLTFSLVLDAMLIYLSLSVKSQKIIQYIASLCDVLCCSKEEIMALSQIAISIIEQNSELYYTSPEIKRASDNILKSSYCYVKQYCDFFVLQDKDNKGNILYEK